MAGSGNFQIERLAELDNKMFARLLRFCSNELRMRGHSVDSNHLMRVAQDVEQGINRNPEPDQYWPRKWEAEGARD